MRFSSAQDSASSARLNAACRAGAPVYSGPKRAPVVDEEEEGGRLTPGDGLPGETGDTTRVPRSRNRGCVSGAAPARSPIEGSALRSRSRRSSLVEPRHTPPEISDLNIAVDVGCGPGTSTTLLAPYFKEVHGYDISEAQITEAKALNKLKNVSFRIDCIEDRKMRTVADYVNYTKTWSAYQLLLKKKPSEAEEISRKLTSILMEDAGTVGGDPERTSLEVKTQFFMILARKPGSK
ncbi:hypothetical protein HPB50_010811 [Hyalomma asiaticum]|uniref:Uncharacterized protein n=1 Tax=Hyalomma asiaticum TaxID=266040 RepID=A0ACB7SLV8_HYAAI|nr:hypothetical protein HPB50_010811 [Hyalomma asiaticum]